MASFAAGLTQTVARKRMESDRSDIYRVARPFNHMEVPLTEKGEKRRRLLPQSASTNEDSRHRRLEERLVSIQELQAEDLPELLALFTDRTLAWSDGARRARSAALFLSYVARASPACSESFVSLGGLTLLGEVLHEAVVRLQSCLQGTASSRDSVQDAGFSALACLKCLQSLQLTQAPVHGFIRSSLTQLKDLHSTNISEASSPGNISELSRRSAVLLEHWQRKVGKDVAARPKPPPPPTAADIHRIKAIDLIAQGLLGTSNARQMAEKVEGALFVSHGEATSKYRQHARMLKSNLALAGNAELRERLVSGSLPVEELVAMDSNALAPEALQEERRVAEEKALRSSIFTPAVPIEMADEEHRLLMVASDSLPLRLSRPTMVAEVP